MRRVYLKKTIQYLILVVLVSISIPGIANARCYPPIQSNSGFGLLQCPTGTVACSGAGPIVPNNELCCDNGSECTGQSPYCSGFANSLSGINTGLGCIQAQSATTMVGSIARWSIGLAGLATLILIIYSGFTIATAEGDPKKIIAAKDTLTSAVLGLILITSAIAILNFIGFDILNLSSLGFRLNP